MIIIKSGVRLGVDRWFDDPWIDDMVLKSSFKCLFDLADNKMATMAEMYSFGWSEDGETWRWRRMLLALEEVQVQECCEILINIVLQPNLFDQWL